MCSKCGGLPTKKLKAPQNHLFSRMSEPRSLAAVCRRQSSSPVQFAQKHISVGEGEAMASCIDDDNNRSTEAPASASTAPAWRLHPANIPTLQEACMSVIRSDQRLMDVVLLQADELGLPQHIVDEILEEEQDYGESSSGSGSRTIPTADQNPDPSCPCRDGSCMAGFFPSSAAFINEHQVVLLDGKSGCLKRCICTFGSGEGVDRATKYDTYHFSDIEIIPEAFHRRWGGDLGSDRYVLRKNGAAVGVASGTMCIFPLHSKREIRTTLRFRYAFPAEKYVSLLLPRLVQEGVGADCKSDEEGVLFALANRNGKWRHQNVPSRPFDLRRIYLKSGATIDVGEDVTRKNADASAPTRDSRAHLVRRTATRVSGPWKNLPKDVQVQSFLDLGDDNIVLLGYSVSVTGSNGGGDMQKREISLFRGSIGMDERGAPTVAWSEEPVVLCNDVKADDDEKRKEISNHVCIYAESSSQGGHDGAHEKSRIPFFVSANNGKSWSQPGSAPSADILCGGKDGIPAVIAISPGTGKLFAFGYDPIECRSAEHKRLMGLTGMKNKQRLQWPSLRVYHWVK